MIRKALSPAIRFFKKKFISWIVQSDEFVALSEKANSNEVAISQLSEYIKYYKSGISIPPAKLQRRVVGGYFHDYVGSGFRAFGDIKRELELHGPHFLKQGEHYSFLDFGSGPGRVTLAVAHMMQDWGIWGCDIDPEAISFAQKEYASIGVNFDTVDPAGHTNFADNKFNVILASSVFTHLNEEMQFAWLKELNRISAPGALLLLSVENKKSLAALNENQLKELQNKGFYFLEGWLTEGLPDWYRTTIHTHEYIKREWSKYFEILDISENGLMQHQDLVICRKPVNS